MSEQQQLLAEHKAHDALRDVENGEVARQRLEAIQNQVRSVLFTALQHNHEVADGIPTIAQITAELSELDADEQPGYLAGVLNMLPDSENYTAVRHFIAQSLSLYSQQEALDATKAEEEKRAKLTDMLNQALANLRQNPVNMTKEITHSGKTITIGDLVKALEQAKKYLSEGVSVAEVEGFLQV